MNLPSISPQSDLLYWCFFRLVYKHANKLEIFSVSSFSFQWHFSIEGNSPARGRQVNNSEQAIKQFVGEHLRIRSQESNTKRGGLWLGTKMFLCPITDKDFNWFRNGSVKRRIPGARSFVLVNLAASTSSWPNNLPLSLRGWTLSSFPLEKIIQ